MAQYVKPGAMFITASNSLRPAGTCTTSNEDVELLGEIFGITDWTTAFATGEGCQDEYPIEEYCKFTSVENGVATVILFS